jgi:hypothetical protein
VASLVDSRSEWTVAGQSIKQRNDSRGLGASRVFLYCLADFGFGSILTKLGSDDGKEEQN